MIYLENMNQFTNLIQNGNVLVDFYATWCGPCQMLTSVLEEFSQQFPNVKVVKVDVDQFAELARSHGIMSVPTLELYQNGLLVKKEIGFHSLDEISSWFN